MRLPEPVGQTLRNARLGMGRRRCRKPVGCESRAPHRLQHALTTDASDCRDSLHPPREVLSPALEGLPRLSAPSWKPVDRVRTVEIFYTPLAVSRIIDIGKMVAV